jgi:hypothetical protein
VVRHALFQNARQGDEVEAEQVRYMQSWHGMQVEPVGCFSNEGIQVQAQARDSTIETNERQYTQSEKESI